MENKIRKIFLCMLLAVVVLTSVQPSSVMAMLAMPEMIHYTPAVLMEEITEHTSSVPVYVYDDTTLYIENGSEIIYQKFYSQKGLKNVKIKRQKGGSKLKFYLIAKVSGKVGDVVTRKVTKLPVVAPEQLDPAVPKPIVPKRITSKTTNIQVTGKKNAVLVIKNEKKTLKTVKFKKNGEKKITIPAQKKGTLYFYMKKGNHRSKVVSRSVKDVTAPRAPSVKIKYGKVCVKGEVGTKIYLKGAEWWSCLGLILDKEWAMFQPGKNYFDTEGEYYEIYLKDAAGNKSRVVRIKNPEPGPPPFVVP